MNASILTIGNSFISPVRGAGAPSKADARHECKPSSAVAEDQSHEAPAAPTEEADNIRADAGNAAVDRPTREFRQVLREKTGDDSAPKVQNESESKEPSAASDPAEPKQVVQAWLAENSVPVPQSEDAAATGVEPKAGRELGQLISGLNPQESTPVTGHAAKSAQIKALLSIEKGQLGLKTVLPEKSNGLNGLQVVSPEEAATAPAATVQPVANGRTDKVAELSGAAVDAKTLSDGVDAGKEVVPEAHAETGGKPAAADKQPQKTDASVASDATQAPATNAEKDLMSSTFADKDGTKTGGDGQKVHLAPPLPSTQTDLAEKQTEPASSELRKDAPNVRAGLRQRQPDSSDANSEEPMGGGSDIANGRRFVKAGTAEVYVSDGQGKNQSRAAGDHGATQNVAQMVSPNNPHVPTVSQPAAPAANTKPANLPGQNPSADISKQILESIHGSPSQQGAERQITVRLNPPELGRVFIKLQEHQAGLTGILEVSRSQTRFEIERALPEIIRNLADCGIQVRRFDVVVSEQGRSDHEAFGGQSMANNGRYEHNPADREPWANEADLGALNQWSPGSYSDRIFSGPQELLVTDGSINMLI